MEISNCKMAILGDSNVGKINLYYILIFNSIKKGKTSIAIRFVKNEFHPALGLFLYF